MPRFSLRSLPSFVLALVAIGSLAVEPNDLAGRASAGDWPQILGPHRNGDADDEPLPDRWKSPPAPAWKYPLGQGYAGPVAVGERVLVFHRQGGNERLEALHSDTGKPLWKIDFPASYRGGVDPDVGPRCVPLVHHSTVYVYGASGALHAVSLETGEKRWSRDLGAEFQADEGYFGAGSTPIVAGDKLLVNVGGKSGAGLVALELEGGAVAWQATDEGPSYSSPTLATLRNQPVAIFVTRMNCVGVDPNSGAVRFKFPFGKRGPTVNAATPLVVGDQLFVSASYGIGAQLAKLAKDKVEPVWSNDESLSSQYSTAVYFDGHLYGSHGREDIGVAELRCVRLSDGHVAWSAPNFGVAHVIRSGDKLLALSVSGKLTLLKATPERFEPLGAATIAQATTRALPALARGRLVVRTNVRGGDGELLSVPVR